MLAEASLRVSLAAFRRKDSVWLHALCFMMQAITPLQSLLVSISLPSWTKLKKAKLRPPNLERVVQVCFLTSFLTFSLEEGLNLF